VSTAAPFLLVTSPRRDDVVVILEDVVIVPEALDVSTVSPPETRE
jgi:hypothetical protein